MQTVVVLLLHEHLLLSRRFTVADTSYVHVYAKPVLESKMLFLSYQFYFLQRHRLLSLHSPS